MNEKTRDGVNACFKAWNDALSAEKNNEAWQKLDATIKAQCDACKNKDGKNCNEFPRCIKYNE